MQGQFSRVACRAFRGPGMTLCGAQTMRIAWMLIIVGRTIAKDEDRPFEVGQYECQGLYGSRGINGQAML